MKQLTVPMIKHELQERVRHLEGELTHGKNQGASLRAQLQERNQTYRAFLHWVESEEEHYAKGGE